MLQLEGEKNKLENLLHNNLMKKRDRILGDMQEVSAEDQNQKLDTFSSELQTVDQRIIELKSHSKGKLSLKVFFLSFLFQKDEH